MGVPQQYSHYEVLTVSKRKFWSLVIVDNSAKSSVNTKEKYAEKAPFPLSKVGPGGKKGIRVRAEVSNGSVETHTCTRQVHGA